MNKRALWIIAVLCLMAVLASCNVNTNDPAESPSLDGETGSISSVADSSSIVVPPSKEEPTPSVSIDPDCEHVTALDPAVEPTCTEKGKTEGSHCSKCGEVLVAQKELPEKGHDWSEANCESAKTCLSCGATEGVAQGHQWNGATCITAKTCAVCGKTEGAPLGHNYQDGVCSVCGLRKASEGLKFSLNSYEDGYIVTGIGSCRDITLIIPEEHEGKPVVAIAKGAFKSLQKIEEVYIPGSIKTIGQEAFSGCSGLKKLTLGEGITELGVSSFYSCVSLETVVFPKSMESIRKTAFSQCSALKNVELNQGLEDLEYGAFQACVSLEEIVIPGSVGIIRGDRGFYGENIAVFQNCKKLKKVTLSEGVHTIERMAFAGLDMEIFCIPSSMCTIGAYAFNGSYIDEITFKSGISTIGEYAFSGSGIASIVLPEGLKKIDNYAFKGCVYLEDVTFPETLESIGGYAFQGCKRLEGVTIPKSVTEIVMYAFYECESLSEVVFEHDGWGGLAIGDQAFCRTALKHVVVPAGVTRLTTAFSTATLESIVIPSGVTVVDSCVFYYGCNNLQDVWCEAPEKPAGWAYDWDEGCYANIHWGQLPGEDDDDGNNNGDEDVSWSKGLVFELNGDGNAYFVTGYGSCEDQHVVIPSMYNDLPVVGIGQGAFYNCTTMTAITIPDSIELIEDVAFYGCSALQTIVIPDSVRSIGMEAFANCRELESVVIGRNVKIIGQLAFFRCNFESIVIPASVVNIKPGAFSGCNQLKSIEVSQENPVYYIDGNCIIKEDAKTLIAGCNNSVIPADVVRIESLAFYCMEELETIIIPISVVEIGSSAFMGCNDLADIWCEAPSLPAGWEKGWNTDYKGNAYGTVHWGYGSEEDDDDDVQYSQGLAFKLDGETGAYIVTGIGSCKDKIVIIPRTYNGKPVAAISEWAFMGCSDVECVVVPDTIETIGGAAFYEGPKAVYCEAEGAPVGWSYAWKPYNRSIYWGGSWEYKDGMPVCKMFEIGSEQWMEWLAHVELGVYGNVYDERQGFIQSSQYQADYDGDDGPMESSSWEIWPYNSRDEENPVSDISKFHLMLRLEGIDVSDGIGTEDYSYTWKVHYKTVGSDDAYRMIEFAPWRSVSLGDGAIYTSDLMGRGMEKPEVGDTFHMVFFIYDGDGELVGWTSRLVDWTDSSEAYYQDALKYGLI